MKQLEESRYYRRMYDRIGREIKTIPKLKVESMGHKARNRHLKYPTVSHHQEQVLQNYYKGEGTDHLTHNQITEFNNRVYSISRAKQKAREVKKQAVHKKRGNIKKRAVSLVESNIYREAETQLLQFERDTQLIMKDF